MTTSGRVQEAATRRDENGNCWEAEKRALESKLASINTLLGSFVKPEKNAADAQMELNLLERKCVLLTKLMRYSDVVKEASIIIAKRSPPSNIVFKCVIVAMCRLGQIEEARKVRDKWEPTSSKDAMSNDFRGRIGPMMEAAKAQSGNSGEVFKSLERSQGLALDWFLQKGPGVNSNWKFRQPPRFASALFLCPRGENCHFGESCVGAHSSAELEEWKKRVELRNRNWEPNKGAKPASGLQYLHDVTKKINETPQNQIRTYLADELKDVKFRCQQALKISTESKVHEWKMIVASKSPVRTVSLLHDRDRNNFWISGAFYHSVTKKKDVDLFLLHEVNAYKKLQVANTFVPSQVILNQMGGWPEWFYYKLDLRFESPVPGTFQQTMMFDFKTDPKLVKHVTVELLPSPEPRKQVIEEPSFLNPKVVVPVSKSFSTVLSNALPPVSPLPVARPPMNFDAQNHFVQSATHTHLSNALMNGSLKPRLEREGTLSDLLDQDLPRQKMEFIDLLNLTRENYLFLMDKFLHNEVSCMQDELSKLDGVASVEFIIYCPVGREIAKAANGNLYGKLDIGREISEDEKCGQLLLRHCNKVLLLEVAKSNLAVTKPKRYECRVVHKSTSSINILVEAPTVLELGLQSEHRRSLRVQFVLDDHTFREMVRRLSEIHTIQLDFLFPDVNRAVAIPDPSKAFTGMFLEGDFTLNERQKQAYNFIAYSDSSDTVPLLLIGPFGTGKTYTLAQSLRKLLTYQYEDKAKTKILVCTHSNSAADLYINNYLHTWFEEGMRSAKPLRVYYADRLVQTVAFNVKKYCVFTEDGMNFRNPTKEEIMEHQIVIVTLSTAPVLLDLGLSKDTFSHIILDEAAQASEAEAIQPLLLAGPSTKLIIAGDHMQLSPNVFSTGQSQGVSLLDRLENMYRKIDGHPCKIMLTDNYRSHNVILKFASDAFYGGLLNCASVQPVHSQWFPVTIFSSQGEDVLPEDGISYYNLTEVFEVSNRLKELIDTWPESWGDYKDTTAIAVLTPYADQVGRLRAQLRKMKLGFITVERILNVQGKQFRAVFVSTVRTRNSMKSERDYQDLGLMSNPKLLNTALTRAQSLFAVVGDPVSLCSLGNCRRLWDELVSLAASNNSLYNIKLPDLKRQLLELEMNINCNSYAAPQPRPVSTLSRSEAGTPRSTIDRPSSTGFSEEHSRHTSGSNRDSDDNAVVDKLMVDGVASLWPESPGTRAISPENAAGNISLSSSSIWAPPGESHGNQSPLLEQQISSSLSNFSRTTQVQRENDRPYFGRPGSGVPMDRNDTGLMDSSVIQNVVDSVLESPMAEYPRPISHMNGSGGHGLAYGLNGAPRQTVPYPYMQQYGMPSNYGFGMPMGHAPQYPQPMMFPVQQPYPGMNGRPGPYPPFGAPIPSSSMVYTQATMNGTYGSLSNPYRQQQPNQTAPPTVALSDQEFPSLSDAVTPTKPHAPGPKVAPAPKPIKNIKKKQPDGVKVNTFDGVANGVTEEKEASRSVGKDEWVEVKSKKGKVKEVAIPSGEERIEKLVSMGFERKEAIKALQRTNRNLDEAIEYLLRQ